MNLEEIINNMEGRRTRIFLLMEEVRLGTTVHATRGAQS
jgi:hypothetical protein